MKRFFKLFLLLGVLAVFPVSAHAATLYFSPASGSYKAGDTFSVAVFVSSTDQSMNGASGTVSFSKDTVSISSISKSGSIMSLWAQEPSFSNINGTATFEGVAFNPGYTGSSGKIITLNFRAKTAGTATLSISGGSVLANNGNGTEINMSSGHATFTILPAAPKKPVEPVKVVPTPSPVPEPVVPAENVIEVPSEPVVPEAPAPIIIVAPTPLYLTTPFVLGLGLILLLLIFLISHKYYMLRKAIDADTFEDQKERNKLMKYLSLDIEERTKIIHKLKYHKKLTEEEKHTIVQIEKEHQ